MPPRTACARSTAIGHSHVARRRCRWLQAHMKKDIDLDSLRQRERFQEVADGVGREAWLGWEVNGLPLFLCWTAISRSISIPPNGSAGRTKFDRLAAALDSS